MLFNSVDFLIFFPIVVLGYFIVPEKIKNIWLLIASYYFYMSWQPVYALLIFFSTATTYAAAYLISRAKEQKVKRLCLVINLVINLAILFYFKYFNFFIEIVTSVIPSLHLAKRNDLLAVVGISFYTLQSLGYTIDVYRGTVQREKSFLRYALFVSFFPQLVAGPIERSRNLLPQLRQSYRFDYDRVTDGLVMMAWGYFKKVAIADSARVIVDIVYSGNRMFDGTSLLFATILFAFQIYGDFSGYSDIAIGAAKVLGIKLMKNFDRPYSSRSFSEFWSRWHISLSSWFEDYIFRPIVWNSRNKTLASYLAIILVFFISGLWHGASWNYVVWGLIHAVFRLAEMLLKKPKRKLYRKIGIDTKSSILHALQTVKVFLRVCFTYIFFRSSSLSQAFRIVRSIFTDTHLLRVLDSTYLTSLMTQTGFLTNNGPAILVCIVLMLLVERFLGCYTLPEKINTLKAPVRWLFYYRIVLLLLFFGNFGQSRFIYFQF